MAKRLADASELDRAAAVDRAMGDALAHLRTARVSDVVAPGQPLRPGSRLDGARALQLFRSQVESRHVDFASRALKSRGASFYTIGSSGHEGNVTVAAASRPDDPAFLHYRSGAFFVERARQYQRQGHELPDPLLSMLLGCVAARDEPIAGGRHKVFGSRELWIPPQTSTIASHLPKAVGTAFYLERAARLGLGVGAPVSARPAPPAVSRDAIAIVSFGDASANHSVATGAINAACWVAHHRLPVPVLFVCEDNGIGISVPTPRGWIAATYGARPDLRYIEADGLDLVDAYDRACDAVDYVRATRRPAFLHLRVVRLLGHAGSDAEQMYRRLTEIEETEALDPLLASVRLLAATGAAQPEDLRALYEGTRSQVSDLAEGAARRARLATAAEVMAPLAPRSSDDIAQEVAWQPRSEPLLSARRQFWDGSLPEDDRPKPLAVQINRALGDLLVRYPELLVFGEDVGRKGGVYGVTRDLVHRARRGRVFDTLLDESTILGTAIGAAQLGALPVAEIQYLAYLHNAEDQLRGEAASLQFFSQGQYANPMVVRIPGYAYQKGFGGHFHNDHSVAVLRDIPGLVIASPARGDDAVAMLQTCVAAASTCGSVCVFLEPIALYPVRDLHAPGDAAFCTLYDPAPAHVALGRARVHGEGTDLAIVTWANGLYLSLRAQKRLAELHGLNARVVDLRWLAPLPVDDVLREARTCGRVLVVDETRRTGGVSEAVLATLVDGGLCGAAPAGKPFAVRRLTACDSFVPLGDAANLVLVQQADIERTALELCREG